jgi:hypothetical protein
MESTKEKLSASDVLLCITLFLSGIWFLGVFLNSFGGWLDSLGASLCRFSLGAGFLGIVFGVFMGMSNSSRSSGPWLRRMAIYGGLIALIDILYRGWFGGRWVWMLSS